MLATSTKSLSHVSPSCKVDHALFPTIETAIHSDGEVPNLLTDLRDVEKFVASTISDDRTSNEAVVCYGDVLPENETYHAMEEASGEKNDRKIVSGTDWE